MQDNNETYNVFLNGIQLGFAPAEASSRLAALFKITPSQTDSILKTKEFLIKKSVNLELATKYRVTVEAAGGNCSIVPIKSLTPMDFDLPEIENSQTNNLVSNSTDRLSGEAREVSVSEQMLVPAEMVATGFATSNSPASSLWWYTRNGETLGPLSLADLKVAISSQEDTTNELCWEQGTPEWIPVSKLNTRPNEFEMLYVPPPTPKLIIAAPALPLLVQELKSAVSLPAAATATWFHEADGTRHGPLSESAMIELIKSGTITANTAVWTPGFSDWMKVEGTTLKIHLDRSSPPPLSGEHLKNTTVWFLAFAPLIGLVLEYLLASVLQPNVFLAKIAFDNNKYWLVTVALNIGLCIFDLHQLKQAGYDTSKLQKFGFIVPVYLYQRAMALQQNLAYFIVWIASFVTMLVI